jgi:hypothetical protein
MDYQSFQVKNKLGSVSFVSIRIVNIVMSAECSKTSQDVQVVVGQELMAQL